MLCRYQSFWTGIYPKKQQDKKLLNIKQDRFVVSYLGSIGSWYMLDEMILVFKEILKLKPKALFLIITNFEHALVEFKLKNSWIDASNTNYNYILVRFNFAKIYGNPQVVFILSAPNEFVAAVINSLTSSYVLLPIAISRSNLLRDEPMKTVALSEGS